jgi:hypothetical protein
MRVNFSLSSNNSSKSGSSNNFNWVVLGVLNIFYFKLQILSSTLTWVGRQLAKPNSLLSYNISEIQNSFCSLKPVVVGKTFLAQNKKMNSKRNQTNQNGKPLDFLIYLLVLLVHCSVFRFTDRVFLQNLLL